MGKIEQYTKEKEKGRDYIKVPKPVFSPSFIVKEGDGKGALECPGLKFNNWGYNVSNTPLSTWQIRTRKGVQNLVAWAAKEGRRVRVAGFRHSWSNIFGANKDIVIMLGSYNSLVNLPYKQDNSWKSDLNKIDDDVSSVGPQKRAPETGHAFVRVGAGVINEDFRQWCFSTKKYCLPLNVIMVEVTFGGTNAPVCHGAGFGTKTLSDLVVEVEYVDAQGNIQVVNDPEELKVASGCFGLLGVVISITLQVEDMQVAELRPSKTHMLLAVPPPVDYMDRLPEEVKKIMKADKITNDKLAKARDDFKIRCETDYYLEWFWFPYQTNCWVNTWNRHPATAADKVQIKTYPETGGINGANAQALEGTIANHIVNWPIFKMASGYRQAWFFGLTSMAALPNVKPDGQSINALQSDALHFRRGIQNFRVRDTEWEIPIPGKQGKRDYEFIQRAWWDGIIAMYEDKNAPVRIALEMRLTGGSDVLLAPQHGNDTADRFGTVSIEVLTTTTTDPELWKDFKQKIANTWTSYEDEKGVRVNARPHWAKEWEGININGQPIENYLRTAYQDVLPQFREIFTRLATRDGNTLETTRARFGNELMSRFLFDN
ncbi:hypothetical protein DL93DRAFT_2054313 [Clavulina sp. PMI_390]|nr:hypothetical protein DL93DRAFT_2054313 [Clavulina sp. PMI_390]